mgnify:CR=1 FL=1
MPVTTNGVTIITCDEAIAQGISPWNILSIAKFHQTEINNARKQGVSPSEHNTTALPLIKELARQMFVELRKLGHTFHFPKYRDQHKRKKNETRV